MRHTVRRVWAADLWREGVQVCTGPAAARGTSAEAFLRVASVAWAHLQPEERKAVRATCRSGRQLHYRLTTHLRIKLGQDPDQRQQQQQQGQQLLHQPSPRELRASLRALVRRGARLQLLTVWFRDASNGLRGAQLLAALEACSRFPLTHLVLEGAVPLSGAVAEAVAACCPNLSSLELNHLKLSRPSDAVPAKEAEAEYDHGCGQLLTLCGPRLRELQLWGVPHWKAASYMALLWCTALKGLELDAGDLPGSSRCGRYLASPAMEAHVISTVAQLTNLESLCLLTYCDSPSVSPEAVWPHATCVAHLSALTALTYLRLEVSACYDYPVESWSAMMKDVYRYHAWRVVQEAHRTSLLSALGCMPQLQRLFCPGLWLQPSELAPLTALTSVTLMGLLPPAVERPDSSRRGSVRACV